MRAVRPETYLRDVRRAPLDRLISATDAAWIAVGAFLLGAATAAAIALAWGS